MKETRQIVHEFIGVTRYHRRAIENTVRGMGIHHSGHRILMFLAQNEGTPSQKEIAKRFEITPAAVTGTLKKLEREGYILRSVDEIDTRLNRIQVTEKGYAIFEKTHTLFGDVDEAMLDGFSDSERDILYDYLIRMKKNLTNRYEDEREGKK